MTTIQQILADQVNRTSTDRPVEMCIRVKNDVEMAIVTEWLSDCIRREMPVTGNHVKDSQKGRING